MQSSRIHLYASLLYPCCLLTALSTSLGTLQTGLMEKPMLVRGLKELFLHAGEKPINIVQPQGPSFEVNGNEISWLNWNMRISFNHREGLVFHNVG